MPTATTKEDICNLALDLLTENTFVSSIGTPVTKIEVVCQRWYDVTRRDLLRRFVWNFAKTRTQLPLSSSEPDFGYENIYPLPNDFIRLLYIGSEKVALSELDYEIEGKNLLANAGDESSLNIGYIKDETLVGNFDSCFITLLAVQLAKNMAYKVTNKNSVVKRLDEMLVKLELEAPAIDGQERPPRLIERSNLKRSRFRGPFNSGRSSYPQNYVDFGE